VITLVGNGKIFADTVHNYTATPVRRVDRLAQLASGVNTTDAIARFKAAVAKIPNVSTSQPPEVSVIDLNLMGPVLAVRPYTHNDHYWQVWSDTNEAIVRVCGEAGWPAPAPTQINRSTAG
jgi:small conductance mechanosensitive channel